MQVDDLISRHFHILLLVIVLSCLQFANMLSQLFNLVLELTD